MNVNSAIRKTLVVYSSALQSIFSCSTKLHQVQKRDLELHKQKTTNTLKKQPTEEEVSNPFGKVFELDGDQGGVT